MTWAAVNHIDKYLLSDRFSESTKEGSVGALMIFSTLFSVVVIPILLVIHPNIFSVDILSASWLVVAGLLNATSNYIYLKVLDIEEASIVMPIFETMPIFGFIFGYFILGETLSVSQAVGAFLILSACIFLTVEIDFEDKIRMKHHVLFPMLLTAAIFALSQVFFKLGGNVQNYTQSLIWVHVGLFMFGIVLLCIPNNRASFVKLVKRDPKFMFNLNLSSESLTVLGNVLHNYALLLAPVALVMVISSTQSLFVFLYGTLLTIYFPKLFKEKISKKHVFQKLFCILLIIIGTTIISL